METMKALIRRRSTRNFTDRQISEEDLQTILKAAYAAPVAHNEYQNLYLTVVQDPNVLEIIRETAVDCFRDPILDIFYGAPTVVIISTCHGSVPELDMANAGTLGQSMMLAATDLGIDSCYVWGTALAFRAEPDLVYDIHLPEGYDPLGSVAFGYSETPSQEDNPLCCKNIATNRI